jgi:hypothetical protein
MSRSACRGGANLFGPSVCFRPLLSDEESAGLDVTPGKWCAKHGGAISRAKGLKSEPVSAKSTSTMVDPSRYRTTPTESSPKKPYAPRTFRRHCFVCGKGLRSKVHDACARCRQTGRDKASTEAVAA